MSEPLVSRDYKGQRVLTVITLAVRAVVHMLSHDELGTIITCCAEELVRREADGEADES